MKQVMQPQAGDETVVIAEAGVNHNGDVDIAHELVDVAARAGAQFVKFQTFDADKLVSESAAAAPYQRARGATSQRELLDSLQLPERAWVELREHAESSGIGFLSTPFDIDSARMLIGLGVTALKVSSGELTNLPLLRELATLGVPLLLSTGMGDMQEVTDAVAACAQAPEIAIFHCVSAYPAPLEECNLNAIPAMAAALGIPVGWSDHTPGRESAIVAAALGARLFEKHFTLDRTLPGPDHQASLEPDELRDYVGILRRIPVALGDGVKRAQPSEFANRDVVRRSWHAARDLESGDVLRREDLVALRPANGISPALDLEGERLARTVRRGETFTIDALMDHG
ncbi:N-acetylneuraminate synthase family protein [Agromyces sp. LHK192]|uniref:N-acetylneuraminate synthase family protein n=1 Tax=Agromyces sp. LHK192 TaxID=2498704 RepID=UPI000FD9B046|nr:N-acetylneuraminate synthase family protein [Agromyces sp. LHK192]